MKPETPAMSGTTKFWIATVGCAVVAAWCATPIVMAHYFPVDPVAKGSDWAAVMAARGQAGDIFGSINALFSGLAFVGVIVAIFLQSQELRLQREESIASRHELRRTAEAEQKTQEALQRTANAQIYQMAVDLLQDKSVRQARAEVVSVLQAIPIGQWQESHNAVAAEVCRSYDSVGKMTRYGLLPIDFAVDSWGEAILRTWTVLRPYVQSVRVQQSSPQYYKGYEALAIAAEEARTFPRAASAA